MVLCDFKCVLCVNVFYCGLFRINYVVGCFYLFVICNFRNLLFNGLMKIDIIVC